MCPSRFDQKRPHVVIVRKKGVAIRFCIDYWKFDDIYIYFGRNRKKVVTVDCPRPDDAIHIVYVIIKVNELRIKNWKDKMKIERQKICDTSDNILWYNQYM